MTPTPKTPSKPWRVEWPSLVDRTPNSEDYTSKRSAYEAVESIAGCGTRPGITRARVFRWISGTWVLHDSIEPIPAGHVREAATPGEHLNPPQPGIILADCSCGAEYTVPQGRDECGALEKAHREHIAAVTAKES